MATASVRLMGRLRYNSRAASGGPNSKRHGLTASRTAARPAPGQWSQPAADGFWPFIGLCPLLGAADSLVSGLGLGLATLAIACATSTLAWMLRGRLPGARHLLSALLVTAAGVTLISLMCQAYAFEAYLTFGAYLPLIVGNGTIAGRWDELARNAPATAPLGVSLRLGSAFALVLAAVGALRAGADGILAQYADFHLASTPAAAFLLLASLAVGANAVATRRGQPSTAP